MNKRIVLLIIVIVAGFGLMAVQAQEEPTVPPEEMSQMEWFIGDWDVESRFLVEPDKDEWVEDAVMSTIEPILGGYALLETFVGTLGGSPIDAISIRTFNTNLGKWEQRWLDNMSASSFAAYTGEWDAEAGEFVAYSNRSFTPEDSGGMGDQVGAREVFFNIEADRFSWRWERTEDGGDTWKVFWTLEYTRAM